jgi:hypothetical protein
VPVPPVQQGPINRQRVKYNVSFVQPVAISLYREPNNVSFVDKVNIVIKQVHNNVLIVQQEHSLQSMDQTHVNNVQLVNIPVLQVEVFVLNVIQVNIQHRMAHSLVQYVHKGRINLALAKVPVSLVLSVALILYRELQNAPFVPLVVRVMLPVSLIALTVHQVHTAL